MSEPNYTAEAIKRIDKNIDELFKQVSEISKIYSDTQIKISKMETAMEIHHSNNNKSIENFGQRIGVIEAHPALKTNERWKWLLGILGGIYVLLQVFDKVQGLIK